MTEPREFPPRLVDDPELGEAMRSARDRKLSPERLAAAEGAIGREIAQLPPRSRFPRLPRVIATVALFAIVTLVGIRFLRTAPPMPVTAPVSLVETSLAPPATRDDAAVAVATVAVTATALPPAAPTITAAGKTSGGTLAEELRLFDEARSLGAAGDHGAALGRLDMLVKRFPSTSLAPEVDITRAETLVAARRLAEAIPLLSRLVSDPAHAGRRAELERILGDVLRMNGDCAAARVHYRAALDADGSEEEGSAARRGIGACETTR